jgi:superfamily I DNA and/or RNA helicase
MELKIKKAILKYFKNCIEEDSKESLTINLDKSNQIFFPNDEEYNFVEFEDQDFDVHEFEAFYKALWFNTDWLDTDFLEWFYKKEKARFNNSSSSELKWWKYKLNKFVSYENNGIRGKILSKLNSYKKIRDLALELLSREDIVEIFYSSDKGKDGLAKVQFKPTMDFNEFYDTNKNESFYIVLEYIKTSPDTNEKWEKEKNRIIPLYLIWIEITSNEDGSFDISLKDSEPEFLYKIRNEKWKFIFSVYNKNWWEDEDNEIQKLDENIKWLTTFKDKIDFYKWKVSEDINQWEEFILNPCIISWGNNIAFIKSLISDYNWIIQNEGTLDNLQNSALGFLFKECDFDDEDKEPDMINITELNREQESIVEKCLNQNISTIIWPPGTGKSQIVLNLLANMYINNKTVLFASKNNNAVDVIIEKLEKKDFLYYPFLRLGSMARSKEWSEKILKKLKRENNGVHKEYNYSDVIEVKKNIKDIYKEVYILEGQFLDYYQKYEKFELLLWEIHDQWLKDILYSVLPLGLDFRIYHEFEKKNNSFLLDINRLNKEIELSEHKKEEIVSLLDNKWYVKLTQNIELIASIDIEKIKEKYGKTYQKFIKETTAISENIESLSNEQREIESSIRKSKKNIVNFTNIDGLFDFLKTKKISYNTLLQRGNEILSKIHSLESSLEKNNIHVYLQKRDIDKTLQKILLNKNYIKYSNDLKEKLQDIENKFLDIQEYSWLWKALGLKRIDFKKNIQTYLNLINETQDNPLIKDWFYYIKRTSFYDNADLDIKINTLKILDDFEYEHTKYLNNQNSLKEWQAKEKTYLDELSLTFWDYFDIKNFEASWKNMEIMIKDIEVIMIMAELQSKYLINTDNIKKFDSLRDDLEITFSEYLKNIWESIYTNIVFLSDNDIQELFGSIIYLQWVLLNLIKNKWDLDKINIEYKDYMRLVISDLDQNIPKELNTYIFEKNDNIANILSIILSIETISQIKTEVTKLASKLQENPKDISILSKNLFELQDKLKTISTEYFWYRIFDNIDSNKPELHLAIDEIYNAYSRKPKPKNKDIFFKEKYEKIFWKVNIFVTTNQSTFSLPLEKSFYDYLIIDEASQNDLASIVPLLYRCKKVIIIGDPYQLQNIVNLKEDACRKIYDQKFKEIWLDSKNYEAQFKEVYNFWKSKSYGLSAFNAMEHICKWDFNRDSLQLYEHYRCHPDIINFSNTIISNYNLYPKSYIRNENIDEKITPLWIHWLGNIKAGKIKENELRNENIKEAEAIVLYLKKLIDSYWDKVSIWVITPYSNQRALINQYLKNEWLSPKYDKTIFVNTVHKFQWDEKDVILYSPVYPHSSLWNDRNLLNVAVSRAKSSFLIFWDKDAIFHAPSKDWTNLLKDLIVYIDNISKQKLEQEKFDKINTFDTSYEKIFYDELKKAKIKFDFHTSIQEWQYELDFRLKLKWADQYINIELDGNVHDKQKSYDHTRNTIVTKLWYKEVIRYTNRYMMQNLWEIINWLKKVCEIYD